MGMHHRGNVPWVRVPWVSILRPRGRESATSIKGTVGMRYAITAVVAFAIGFFTNEYRGNKLEDAQLEFRESNIVLHVGTNSIILPDEIAAVIALDINGHLREKESHEN